MVAVGAGLVGTVMIVTLIDGILLRRRRESQASETDEVPVPELSQPAPRWTTPASAEPERPALPVATATATNGTRPEKRTTKAVESKPADVDWSWDADDAEPDSAREGSSKSQRA